MDLLKLKSERTQLELVRMISRRNLKKQSRPLTKLKENIINRITKSIKNIRKDVFYAFSLSTKGVRNGLIPNPFLFFAGFGAIRENDRPLRVHHLDHFWTLPSPAGHFL